MIAVRCISNMPYITGEGFKTEKPLTNLTLGKIYKAKIVDYSQDGDNWIVVWDDFDEDYLYPPDMFEILSDN